MENKINVSEKEHRLSGHTCQICGKKDFTWVDKNEKLSSRAFLNHLRVHNISFKEYYDKYLFVNGDDVCDNPSCSKKVRWKGGKYQPFCSNKCAQNDPNKIEIIKNRFVDNPELYEQWLKRRGKVDGNVPKRRETIRKKAESMGLTEYEYYSQHAKRAAKKITKERRAEIVQKTMLQKIKTGSHKKIGYWYEYVWYGDTWNVQGFEPFLLDVLQYDLNVSKGSVFQPNVERGFLFDYFDNDGIQHLYYPDFVFVENGVTLVLEVKSTHTLKMNEEMFYQKGLSVIDSGYSYLPIVISLPESGAPRGTYKDDNVLKWWSAGNRLRERLKTSLDWAISSQASNPDKVVWYDEGSTTIPYGSTLKREEMARISYEEIVI